MNKEQTIHFTGIKGCGMSALALVLNGEGYKVQGSDLPKYFFTQKGLEEAEVPMFEFNPENITKDMLVIAGNAFPDSHEELVAAREKGAEVVRYHKFLGELLAGYTSVAVTGSHGKTSTTGLLSHVLSSMFPTSYLIGDGTGFGVVDSKYFVLEACEYKRHFMAYHPDYAVMTNIDFDHPDYYTDIEDVQSAFEAFGRQVQKGIIACGDDERLRQIDTTTPITFYGINENNQVVAKNIEKDTNGSHFDCYIDGELFGHFDIPTYGTHNILNALAVITFFYLNELSAEELAKHLKTFNGVKRRFSEKKINDITIIDDYAHHPSEIRATLDAARQKYPNKKVVAVFQPHTFTRTIALISEFAQALSLADDVYLCDIFASVRETGGQVSIQDLADLIEKEAEVLDVENLSPLLKYKDAVIVFMGAGDVQKFEFAYERLLSDTMPNKQ
ncbi:UDP-N-acetylmuramate--L-alanine ligase [Granulicatella balaenopterae]|uniref:UDP-N-acetylmuramate--L-alanine ligase n=1 Tax=Granulicatella balaenopterae TaxID=137733 RepID=A0A1H9MWG5_9LACT|nr:UDP-N-acetylmuramate--L-alanine ligase [Granulicatella balaenopterae]